MKFKSKFLCTVVVLMVILLQISVLVSAQGQSTDPEAILHFTDNYDGWGLWDSEITTDPAYPERGNVIKANPDRGGWFIFKNLKPNTKYIATADARVDGDIDSDDIFFEVMDFIYGNSGDHSEKIKAPVKSKDYQTVSIEFTTGDSTELNITCWSYSKTVGAYFDNIKVKEVTNQTDVPAEPEAVEESGAVDSETPSVPDTTDNPETSDNPKTSDVGVGGLIILGAVSLSSGFIVLKRRKSCKN